MFEVYGYLKHLNKHAISHFSLRLQIRVDNIALRLVEDRPPPNITSPGTPPIDVAIPTLLIVRDKSGLFSIRAAGKQTPSSRSQFLQLTSFRPYKRTLLCSHLPPVTTTPLFQIPETAAARPTAAAIPLPPPRRPVPGTGWRPSCSRGPPCSPPTTPTCGRRWKPPTRRCRP